MNSKSVRKLKHVCLTAVMMLWLASVVSAQAGTTAPTIRNVAPTSGPVGTAVTITGVGFGAAQGASIVTLNGTLATATSWSATKIVISVPQQAPSGQIVVKVGGTSSDGAIFKVTQ